MTITVGSLFSGVGSFERGLELTGHFQTKWQVEIDPEARRVLRKHWPNVRRHHDVKKVGKHNLEPVDVIVFGSPCQGMSLAGKGEGLADPRSGLFHEAIRIIGELQPAVAIWENVPGALTSNSGRDFATVLASFRQCGAVDISWRILDARYFGVAQRRRRVFLVADFAPGRQRTGEVLFKPPSVPGHTQEGKEARKETTHRTGGGAGGEGGGRGKQRGRVIAPEVAAALTAGGHPNSNAPGRRREDDHNIIAFNWQEDQTFQASSESTNPLRTTHTEAVAYIIHSANSCAKERHAFATDVAKSIDTTGGLASNQGGTVIGFNAEFSNQAAPGGDVIHAIDTNANAAVLSQRMMLRRLTPIEVLRLFGLPDDHLDVVPELSDSSKYRLCGNSICVPVIEWLGRRLVACWESK